MRVGRRVTLLSSCLVLTGGVLFAPTTALAAPATCSLQPVLRDVTINQGVGSYSPLVRGKDTVVRLFLSLPSCAGNTASIQVTGATLAVSSGGTVSAPTPRLAATYPSLVPYTTGAAVDAPGNPVFLVPGSMLAPSGGTSGFTASFTATVQWSAKSSGTATPVVGSTTYRTKPDGTAFAATVDRRTNALRLLLVPMGDARQTYVTQFPVSAQETAVNALATVSRVFPVPSGLGSLSGTTGGLRYAIDPTLLDIGDLIEGSVVPGKFCGGGSTQYSTISSRLAQFLQSWNSANPTATADRVVGVVAGEISGDAASGCALGWSQLNTNQSWFRADPLTSPQTAGSVATMEIAHSLGLVPPRRAAAVNPGHSPNIVADGTAPDRAYDTAAARYDRDNHTAMRVYGTWADTNTVFEQLDFADLRCRLGGAVTADCTTTGTVGTSVGVGNGVTLRITGTTDGTVAGTHVTESGFIQNGDLSVPPATSEYRLVQRQNAKVLQTDLITASDSQEMTTVPEPTIEVPEASTSDAKTFSASVLFQGDKANRVDVVRVVNGSSQVLLTLSRSTLGRPVVDPPTVTPGAPVDVSNQFYDDESAPAVSPDGRYVAWTGFGESGRSVFISTADGENVQELITDAREPAWNADGTRLAYVALFSEADSELRTADFFDGDGFGTGNDQVLYTGSPRHPTWSPDDQEIAFAEDGDLFAVSSSDNNPDATPTPDPTPGPTARRLTSLGDASWPSWSRTAGNNQIAFERQPNCDCESNPPPSVSLLNPTTLAVTPFISEATEPAFADDGNILVNLDGALFAYPAVGGVPSPAAAGPASAPARAAGITAFAGYVDRDEGGDDDIFVSQGYTVSGTVHLDTVTNRGALRAELRLSCPGGLVYPIAVGIPLEVVNETTATYTYVLDTAPICAGGSLFVLATDGFSFSLPTSAHLTTGGAHAPVPAIYRPVDGSTFLQYDAIVLSGSAFDLDTGSITGSTLRWTFDDQDVGSGRIVGLSPPAGGFTAGQHHVTLTVTDPSGAETTTRADVTVVGDEDHDGIPDTLEPLEASGDCDNDGIPNIDEIARGTDPCTSPTTDYSAIEDFNPDSLNVPSSGNNVTDYVRIPYRDITQVDPATVALTDVSGHVVRVPVVSWSISGGVATAKLDRAKVTQAIAAAFAPGPVRSGRVVLTLTGSSRAGVARPWSFTGNDTTYVIPG